MQLKLILSTSTRIPDTNEFGIDTNGNLVVNTGTSGSPTYVNPVQLSEGLTQGQIIGTTGAGLLIPKIFDCLNIVDGTTSTGGICVAGNKILHIAINNGRLLLNKCSAGTCSTAGEVKRGPDPTEEIHILAADILRNSPEIDKLYNVASQEEFDIKDNLTDIISLNTLHNSYAEEQGFCFMGRTTEEIGFGGIQLGFEPEATEYFKEGDFVEITVKYTVPNNVDGFAFENDPMGYMNEQFCYATYANDNLVAATRTDGSTNLGNIHIDGMPMFLDSGLYVTRRFLYKYKSECTYDLGEMIMDCTSDYLRLHTASGPQDFIIKEVRKVSA